MTDIFFLWSHIVVIDLTQTHEGWEKNMSGFSYPSVCKAAVFDSSLSHLKKLKISYELF